MISIFIKLQINKIRNSKQCDMTDLSAVSSLASKMGMKSLVTFLYTNSEEYLEYVKKSEKE